MFATPFTSFHTILSLIALVTGAGVIRMLLQNRHPDLWTVTFLFTMIATDATGFMFPFQKLLPSHHVAILSLALIAVALLAQYAFRFAGAWRWIYALTIGIAVYLNFFVFVTQLFLKIPALHALAPGAPDKPEPPFLIVQAIVLVIFGWLIWRGAKNFRPAQ